MNAASATAVGLPHIRALPWAGAVALLALSALLRTRAIDAGLWIDEGIAVGIAAQGPGDVFGLLRRDGSPPLYFLALWVWTEFFGDSERALHSLSLVFALACVPAAWLAAGALWGARAAWCAAGLAALSPYLTFYAQEARMYALLALLSIACSALFALAFARRERRALPWFALALALASYTHNWALFLAGGFACAVAVMAVRARDRRLAHDGVLAFGGALALYAPWIPTLLAQLRDTGAPWSDTPGAGAPFAALADLLGGPAPALAFATLAGAGLWRLRGAESRLMGRIDTPADNRRVVGALLGATAAALALAWVASQIEPAWAGRYFAVFLGPLLLVGAAGLAALPGRVLVVAGAALAVLWAQPRSAAIEGKSNVRGVAAALQDRGALSAGDLVVVTHPEQGPVLRHYLGEGLRWADTLGPVRDPRVFDWRDAMDRLRAAAPAPAAARALADSRPGSRVVLIEPITATGRWRAPWPVLVRRRAAEWRRLLDASPRLRTAASFPRIAPGREPRGVTATVYTVTGA